jgi:hypothetical protein
MLPIWDYGKEDRVVQHAFHHVLTQLQNKGSYKSVSRLLMAVEQSIAKKEASLFLTKGINEMQ